jgi:hypothetical protein
LVPEGGGSGAGVGPTEEGSIERDEGEETQEEERINQSALGIDDDISSVCTDVLLNLR